MSIRLRAGRGRRGPSEIGGIAGIATLIALLERAPSVASSASSGGRGRTRPDAAARLSAACIGVLTLPFMVFKPAHLAWPVIT